MEIKLVFLAFFSLIINAMIISKPLTIINATTSPIQFEIFAQSYNQPIKATVYPGVKQSYDLRGVMFERMVWSTYGKKDSADAFLLKKYSINVQEKLPTMVNGGTIALSLGGGYICDDKSGKRDAVRFGRGDIVENGNNSDKG